MFYKWNNFVCVLGIVSLCLYCVPISGHASNNYINELVKQEKRLITGLERFLSEQEKNDKDVDASLPRILKKVKDDLLEDRASLDNPVDRFHVLRRYVTDWETVFETVLCPDCFDEDTNIDFSFTRGIVEKHIRRWPSKRDVDDIADEIFHLIDAYDVDLSILIQGQIQGFQTKPFSAEDIMYISNYAEDKKNMFAAVQFLKTYLDLVKTNVLKSGDVTEVRLARTLASLYNRNEQPWIAVEILEEYIKKDPNNKNILRDYNYFKTKASDIPNSDRDVDEDEEKKFLLYVMPEEKSVSLCKEQKINVTKQARLFCYYKNTTNKFYRVKTELVNKFPNVFVLYDVISDAEVDKLRNISSEIHLKSEQNNEIPHDRKEVFIFSHSLGHPVVKNLSQRIDTITGLKQQHNKNIDGITAFEIGGIYSERNDVFTSHTVGHNVASFSVFLTDVTIGGAIAFPRLNITVNARKGSAVMWYNMKRNGDLYDDISYMHCPVFIGSKLVATKWYKEIDQVFTRPCGIKKTTKDRQL